MNERPIHKLLIANRGEIAVRIMRTCKAMRIPSVAVYSDADRRALHVARADEAVYIGASEARHSYLDVQKILDAAVKVGADAIHPGYGFLSENAEAAQAIQDAGLIWVGPHPDAIRDMGSKVYARRWAESHDIPVVPGYDGDDQSDKGLASEANTIGYPLMIKASAGGGGKGIRIVQEASGFLESLQLAKQEAQTSFGDDRIILERYIQAPRHVEVQVMGDQHGNVLHLFTRDCSIQRRHQKIIEEAPAPDIPEGIREAMHDAALHLARSIDYDNAGTVEFLYESATESFYFLEMNTRLQVEHPVTEAITGVDLVEWQLLAASGAALPLTSEDIQVKGVAIEARICAEVPQEEFRPDSGTLLQTNFGLSDIRVDYGFDTGCEISPYYDSMLAKGISHGATRDEALGKLIDALDVMQVIGVECNIAYLRDIVSSPAFRDKQLSTDFLERELGEWTPTSVGVEGLAQVAAVLYVDGLERDREESGDSTPWETLGAWRLLEVEGGSGQTRVVFDLENERYTLGVSGVDGAFQVQTGESQVYINILENIANDDRAMSRYTLEIDGVQGVFQGCVQEDCVVVSKGAHWKRCRRVPACDQYVLESNSGTGTLCDLVAPYPALITNVSVKPGDAVCAGDELLVIEAMKMVHYLTASADGVVKAVHCAPNQSVDSGQLLVEFSTEDE